MGWSRFLIAASLVLTSVTTGWAQATWTGASDDSFSNPANWQGGTFPANDGSETLSFANSGVITVDLDQPGDFDQLLVNVSTSVTIQGSPGLTLEGDGINLSIPGYGGNASVLTLNVPVQLDQYQTWNIENPGGAITVGGPITGSVGLRLVGQGGGSTFQFNDVDSTFGYNNATLGLIVTGSGSYLIAGGSSTGAGGAPDYGPFGIGALELGDGTVFNAIGTASISIANALILGDNSSGDPVHIGGHFTATNPGDTFLTFTGGVTLYSNFSELDIGANSSVTFAGAITGNGGPLTLGNFGTGNSLAILSNDISNVSQVTVNGSLSVIFAGNALSQLSGLTGPIYTDTTNLPYVGMGGSYAGHVAGFISQLGDPFYGTLGFDSLSGTSTFHDEIDLRNPKFSDGGFVGLGSATTATLAADSVIDPAGATPSDQTTYQFGGGGGTLTVNTTLADGAVARNVDLEAGNAPLTLILGGTLSYTGGTWVNGGVLIFDTPPPIGNSIFIAYTGAQTGYVGSTVNSGYTDTNAQDFFNTISVNSDAAETVIGFDSADGSTRTVNASLDMSRFGSNTYLGTATRLNYAGAITSWGDGYQFTAVKGGELTVTTPLTGENTVSIGLPSPIESYDQQAGFVTTSAVTLAGNNSYSGDTTLNSGDLFVTNSNSLGGVGTLYVPDPENPRDGWIATLSTRGGPVNLPNNVYVGQNGLAVNFLGQGLLTFSGSIHDDGGPGQLGIFGPVDLATDNYYTGGTLLGPGAYVYVETYNSLGSGHVNISDGGTAPTLATNQGFVQVHDTIDLHASTLQFNDPGSASFMDISGLIDEVGGAGSLIINGNASYFGGVELEQANTYTGGTTINGAYVVVDDSSSFGTGPVDIEGSSVIEADEDVILHNRFTLNGPLLLQTDDANLTLSNAISGMNSVSVSGNVELQAPNTYTGGTFLVAGSGALLVVSNSAALGSGGVDVAQGTVLAVNSGVTITNPVTLHDGGAIAGYGAIVPSSPTTFEIQNFSTIIGGGGTVGVFTGGSTNALPGTLTLGGNTSLVFGADGFLQFSIADATGAAGTGYSTITSSGTLLQTTNSSTDPFTIQVIAVDPGTGQRGNAINFNPNMSYSWTLLQATGGISAFDLNGFQVATGLGGNLNFPGQFTVTENGNDLMLNFTPVPEPSTWALMASGLCAAAGVIRRRRRS